MTHPNAPSSDLADSPLRESRSAPANDTAADQALTFDDGDRRDLGHAFTRSELGRIFVVALAAAAVWFRLWEPFRQVSVIGLAGLVIGCWPIFQEAFENLLGRRMTMELSMAIAIAAAAAISQLFTALIITLFVLVAEVLERMTVTRGRRAIRDLLEFLPRRILVRRAGSAAEVEADTVRAGDAVLVNPGGRIPVDGTVVAGHSFADESRITGESLPVEKTAGSSAFAGSINQSGALEIRVERVGRDTSYGKIIEAVEQAEHSRAPVERLADRLAGYLIYFALAAAALTYILSRDIRSTISVIIVAGACGVAAGTPLAILGAIGRAARAGAIIKGGLYLEQLGRVDTVVLDKTGTLTFGEPRVQELIPSDGVSCEILLASAASAELRSEHPLGKTIVAYAQTEGLSPREAERFSYRPGLGIEATANGDRILVGNASLMRDHGVVMPPGLLNDHAEASKVYVSRNGALLGAVIIADRVRPEARRAIAAIHAIGIRSLLLTGDTQPIADSIAKQLGITEVAAGLLPEQKQQRVKNLVANGRIVAMVGDGINDAPALIEAQVGVAMGSGADVTRESADVVLIGNDLVKLAETLGIARRARRIIWANFVGTIAVDAVGIGLAGFGVLNPMIAAFIHVTSELLFISNSARLLPARAAARNGTS